MIVSSRRKWIVGLLGLTIIATIITGIRYLDQVAKVGVGYKTKVTCSEIFVAGRNEADVLARDFFDINPLLHHVAVTVNMAEKSVSGSLWGLGERRAVYRENAGCTPNADLGLVEVSVPTPDPSPHVWPERRDDRVQSALMALFDDAATIHPIHTRAALVIQNGDIIAEYYADGFKPSTRHQSWSMAKSVTSALVGILVQADELSLDDSNLMSAWVALDPRAAITLADLLGMVSGLGFVEDYTDPMSDVDLMLFDRADMGEFAATSSLQHTPGDVFYYSSGTTNIISKILRSHLEAANIDYHAFPGKALFNPLGMGSAIFEVYASGTFIGSSYLYATPRDFARFGQLFLQGGVWEGLRILPQSWIDYTQTPIAASNGEYGAHWWLRPDGLPDDTYYMGGNDGQYVMVIPSLDAVIVRLGVTRAPATYEDDIAPLMAEIVTSLRARQNRLP